MKKQHLTLPDTDRTALETLLSKGALPVKTFKRATALLELDHGKTLTAVAATLAVKPDTVAAWRNAYQTTGLACLDDAPRPGRPIVIDGAQRAKITALAWSDAPDGHDHWTLRLLAEKVVEAGFCDTISHTMVGNILQKCTEPSSVSDLVHWNPRCALSGTDGAHSRPLCFALRP